MCLKLKKIMSESLPGNNRCLHNITHSCSHWEFLGLIGHAGVNWVTVGNRKLWPRLGALFPLTETLSNGRREVPNPTGHVTIRVSPSTTDGGFIQAVGRTAVNRRRFQVRWVAWESLVRISKCVNTSSQTALSNRELKLNNIKMQCLSHTSHITNTQ